MLAVHADRLGSGRRDAHRSGDGQGADLQCQRLNVRSARLFGTDGVRGAAGSIPSIRRPSAGSAPRSCARCRDGDASGRAPAARRPRHARVRRVDRGRAAQRRGGEGAVVTSAGVVPTPAVAYLTRVGGYDAGIVISASHNPFEDNGIKVFSGRGEKFTERVERAGRGDRRRRLVDTPRPGRRAPAAAGAARRRLPGSSARRASRSRRRSAISSSPSTAPTARRRRWRPQLFASLGFETVVIGERARRPEHQPATADRRIPKRLARTVVERGCQMGVAFDGDGDRAIFVDHRGEIVNGDAVLLMCARQLQREGRLRGQRDRRDRDEQHRPRDRAAASRASAWCGAPSATST